MTAPTLPGLDPVPFRDAAWRPAGDWVVVLTCLEETMVVGPYPTMEQALDQAPDLAAERGQEWSGVAQPLLSPAAATLV